MRFLLNQIRRSVAGKCIVQTNKSKSVMGSATLISPYQEVQPTQINEKNRDVDTNRNLSKSWGQQCSPNCGCVLRFETVVDHEQRIVDCTYVAKSVVTTVDKENGGRLTPVYTTRMNRPMLQECKCHSIHALARQVTSFLPNKKIKHIQDMNDFTFTRSSLAFRHAVLAEHNLPRTDTHCFDVVEEAFAGMINTNVPSKRRLNANFQKVLTAEYLQRPLVVQYRRSTNNNANDNKNKKGLERRKGFFVSDSGNGSMGTDRNRISMSSPKATYTLQMFDINSEHGWDEDECDRGVSTKNANSNQFDWVSYVDELHQIEDYA